MSTTEVLRYGVVELDDTLRKEGRLRSFGSVQHALSDAAGNMEASTVDIKGSDVPDRPIGTRLAAASTKFVQRDEMAVYALSSLGRKAGTTPRIISRTLLQDASYGSAAGSSIEFELQGTDPLFCDGGAFGPDKTFPTYTIPQTYFVNAPVDAFAKFMPVIIGEKSDECAIDPVTNLPASKGLCPLIYVGQDGLATGPNGTAQTWGMFVVSLFACYKILGLYGSDLGVYGIGNLTTDGATNSTLTLGGSPDLSAIAVNTDQITVWTSGGIKSYTITAVNAGASQVTISGTVTVADTTFSLITGPYVGADWKIGTQPATRTKIDLSTRNGVDVMVPGYAGYVRATPYEDIVGSDGQAYRVTLIWARGPLLDAALSGSVTLAANVIGVEDQGDGTGLPITDYFTAYYWWLINCVMTNTAKPSGGKWPQTDGDIAAIGGAWADGTYKVRGSSFAAAQAISKIKIGGAGYQVNAYFDKGTPTRDVIHEWNDAGNCRLGVNEHGQTFVSIFDETQDPTTWPRVEHVSRVFGPVQRTNPQAETENVVQGQYDYDPDASRYRQPLVTITSPAGIAHNKGIRKLSPVVDGQLTANTAQFITVLKSRLAYAQDGPVYVTFTGDIGLLDYPLGSGLQLTSPMGPGSVGYVDQPVWIIKKSLDVDRHLVTVTCLDVGSGSGMGTLVPLAQQFVIGNESLSTGPLVGNEGSGTGFIIVA